MFIMEILHMFTVLICWPVFREMFVALKSEQIKNILPRKVFRNSSVSFQVTFFSLYSKNPKLKNKLLHKNNRLKSESLLLINQIFFLQVKFRLPWAWSVLSCSHCSVVLQPPFCCLSATVLLLPLGKFYLSANRIQNHLNCGERPR